MGIAPSKRMLNTNDIEKALKNYPNFNGVFAVDQLPGDPKPGLYIANTDPSYKDGEHWVLLYKCKEGTTEFFDTFGREPKKCGQANGNIVQGLCNHLFLQHVDTMYYVMLIYVVSILTRRLWDGMAMILKKMTRKQDM